MEDTDRSSELSLTASFSGVHRISIVEKTSCIPLHDKVWVWKEDETSPKTVANIVSLYYQFARTVGTAGDKENIVSVSFDTQVEQEKKFKKRHNYNKANRYNSATISGLNTTGTFPSTTLRQRPLASIKSVPMEMVCASNDSIIVAVFVAPEIYKSDPKKTAKEILNNFTQQYQTTLQELKPTFVACLKDLESARNDLSLLPHFEKFTLPVFTTHSRRSGPTRLITSSRVDGSETIMLTSDEN